MFLLYEVYIIKFGMVITAKNIQPEKIIITGNMNEKIKS